jgi:hypothetical protein
MVPIKRMRAFAVLSLIAALSLGSPRVQAHIPGQPPFVYINEQPAPFYPVGYASLPDLAPPNDIAPGQYLVNSPIHFRLDVSVLPFFPEDLPFIEFKWDFDDGTTAIGADQLHSYPTPGMRTVSVSNRDTRTNETALVLSTVSTPIVPTADYVLPQPMMKINGQVTTDQFADSIPADFTKRVTLDASDSRAGSAKIVGYTWDLGNQQLARDSKVTIAYKSLYSTVQPVLRLTDSNGLFVDASFMLENTQLPGPNSTPPNAQRSFSPLTWAMLGSLLLLGVALTAHLVYRYRHHSDYHRR